ncbi:hypothetical protein JYT91_00835 [archaeon AH-315-M20]|nr:hypothetical protein [archaeon AH-315-M20]
MQKNKEGIKLIYLIIIIFSLNSIKLVNASIEKIPPDQTIKIKLEYKTGTIWDSDNDGVETIRGVVDLTVENTVFNWDVNEKNLCTRWETYSLDDSKSTTLCYGSENCCNFINLAPTRANWSETFYSYYELYGATFNNIISAQVLYVDYNLSLENPYVDVYYSSWYNLSAIYENIAEDVIEQETSEDLGNVLDITISTPPPFITKNSTFDIKVILTNFGTEILYDLPVNLILAPSLISNESMQQTLSNLGSGQGATLIWSITSTDSELEKYIMVTVGNKIEIKLI